MKKSKELFWINYESKKLKAFRTKTYNSKQWRVTRAYVLSSNPYCKVCEEEQGRLVKATDVDHVKPISELLKEGRLDLVYDIENLQPLCHTCHSKKSYTEGLGKNKKK
jgi:5-methylcytosine-specific restriction protein A